MKVGGWGICAVVGGWEGGLKGQALRGNLFFQRVAPARTKPDSPKPTGELGLSPAATVQTRFTLADFPESQTWRFEASPPRPSPHVNSFSHCCLHTRFCGDWRFAGGGVLFEQGERCRAVMRFKKACPLEFVGHVRHKATPRPAHLFWRILVNGKQHSGREAQAFCAPL